LEELDENSTKTDGVQPHSLLASIRTPQLIIALIIIKPIFNLMKNLSVFLQKENCDLSHCVNYANDVYEEIHNMRQNAEEKFKSIFVKALK